jgi:hypothetical protein
MTLPAPNVCANHPGVETSLRCNRCEKPICAKCAVRTPIGYRCKDCVRGQQKVFETAQWLDYILGFCVAGILSLITSLLVTLASNVAGFFAWFVIVAAAPTVGIILAEALRFVTRKHRSKYLFGTIVVAIVLGALPVIIFELMIMDIFGIVFQVIYLVVAVPIVYYRLSGIQMMK